MKKGEKMSEEQKKKISNSECGKVVSKKTCVKISMSKTGKSHAPHSEETRKKLSLQKMGYKNPRFGIPLTIKQKESLKIRWTANGNPNWKGGITPENRRIRTSIEYKQWRMSVFKRDWFACILCGYKGKDIHADHIKKFSDYPELRLDISNGRTLCIPCHRKTDTWGHGKVSSAKSFE
mgnify:CR=1 FL=1